MSNLAELDVDQPLRNRNNYDALLPRQAASFRSRVTGGLEELGQRVRNTTGEANRCDTIRAAARW